MYSRKGEPPIMVKAHRRGLPNSKAADVSPAGESRFDLYDGDGMPSAVGKQLDAPDSQGHGGSRALSMARDLSTAEPPRPPLNRITFELRDIEGLPNFVVGKQLDGAAKELETWRLLKRAMDTKQEVYARVLQKTASGFMVDILGRVAFLPMSLSGQRDSVGSRDIDRTAGERDK
ncbi:hypothetical protein T492DRAFT_985830 [Pavlovales sp. CCMP2436]|nr:hypothetical protein T492DRAFT_985830 [Pavlovales sp. CCMP2436]